MRRIFAIGWAVWLFDFATKVWAIEVLASREPVKIVGSFLQLTFIKNPGAAFSLGSGFTIVFSLFALAVAVFITYFSTRVTSKGWMVVMGLVLGGVFGNLTDRIFREPGFLSGHVIDWIQLPMWPVFNIADTAIVIAASLAVYLSVRDISPIGKVR